ncbi:MAG: hypothetical protein KDK39_14735 [Leptospiraceae bacterium]|nr:hypothetical protein [Leptospiraceae bacterium]
MRDFNYLKTIWIADAVKDTVVAQRVASRVGAQTRVEYIADPASLMAERQRAGSPLDHQSELLVHTSPGRWIASCPGSDGMVCCQYFVINFGLGCLFDCHYCYLQTFLNNPLMSIFANLEDLYAELEEKTRGRNFHFRIGTGEYTDSLVLEELTGIGSELVRWFAGRPNLTLELKTKSTCIDPLLDLDHRGNTVLAWSLNPQVVIDTVEDHTASLAARLEAAARAGQAGYRLAFHLDPLIAILEWRQEYKSMLDQVFASIDPDQIAWISIGSFRYSPGLKERIQSRFIDDQLTRAEMVQGADGKLRYFKTIRAEMYRAIKSWIEAVDPGLFTYLCMETRHMWQGVYGYAPENARNLDAGFERRRQTMLAHQTGYTADPMQS